MIEFVEAVLQASQRCEVGCLDRPKAGVGSVQFPVFSQRAGGEAAERKEVTAADEEFEQKLAKETLGVVCYYRPKAGVGSVQCSAFSQRAGGQPVERKEVTAADEEFEQKLAKETLGVVCYYRPKAGVGSVQCPVFSQRAGGEAAERKEVTAADEEFKQKLTKETKGVVRYYRPKAGVGSVQCSVCRRSRGVLTQIRIARGFGNFYYYRLAADLQAGGLNSPSPSPVAQMKPRGTKIFVPETAYHHVFAALPEGMRLVAEPDPGVDLAVLGMHHAEQLPAFLAALPGLQAVQSLNAGVDWLLPDLPAGVAVYNASGVHDAAVAEWVVAVLLAMRRRLPDLLELQRRGEWDANLNDVTATGPSSIGPIDTFEGGTVLILGYGSIGRAVAARLAPFGIRVRGIARRRRADAEPMEALPGRLAEADAVVLLLPLTPATEHLVDADFLARMKPGSILVNAARGRLVDTEALLAALHGRRIRAALDVTDPEPLPPGHPLWQAPNVMITPHVAGAVESWRRRAYLFANEQVRSFAAGAPLKNIVSRY